MPQRCSLREPYQVIILPYRLTAVGLEFLIAKRSDDSVWQAFAGGGEAGESILESAQRELKEEANLEGVYWVKLDSVCMIPRIHFKGYEKWKSHPYVIPEYAFMTQVDKQPTLSQEHCEFSWCSFTQAVSLLHYDSNKTAIWEAHQRLAA